MVIMAVLAEVIFFSRDMLLKFNSRTRMANSPNKLASMKAPIALNIVAFIA